MRLLTILLIPLLTCSAFAKAEHSCMYQHIREAMTLNQERKPLYAALTSDKSLPVSEALIQFEKKLLIPSLLADLIAFPYQLAGSRIVCDEYISMSETPAFHNSFDKDLPNPQEFQHYEMSQTLSSLELALEQRDFPGVASIADKQIKELEQAPRFHCLMRHFLESIRRIAGLAPAYKSGGWLSVVMLKGHLQTLSTASEIDMLAAPVQAMGVPIICQDVPHIPAVSQDARGN